MATIGEASRDRGMLETSEAKTDGSVKDGIPKLKLFFEWRGGVLWCANDLAFKLFDCGPVEDRLPLSDGIKKRMAEMTIWHDTALDWNYPPDPSPWPEEEFIKFHKAVEEILSDIKQELGPGYEIINRHSS